MHAFVQLNVLVYNMENMGGGGGTRDYVISASVRCSVRTIHAVELNRAASLQ